MNECNSIEAIDKTILSEQTKFWLSEIIGIGNNFNQKINQRKSCSGKISKYVTALTIDNLRSENEEYKVMRLSSVKSNI